MIGSSIGLVRVAWTLAFATVVVVDASSSALSSQTTQASAAETIARLEQAVAARASDVDARRRLADAYAAAGRHLDAVDALRKVTALAPKSPGGWYALGQAYNAIKQEALRTFDERPEDAPWRQLLTADALVDRGQWTDAFFLYRDTLDHLPSMIGIHDAIASIYARTGHTEWATRERARADRAMPAPTASPRASPSSATSAASAAPAARIDCAARRAFCEFRAGRHASALAAALSGSDAESRYWRARAANTLALAAFDRLDTLPDSRERRIVRATRARAEQRYPDAVAELRAALALTPGDPALAYELAAACYLMRDYEQTVATLSPLLDAHPDDPRLLELMGYALLQRRQLDRALPILRRAVQRDAADPGPRLALGRAYLQSGEFAAAVPLIEAQLATDRDGSLHVQLARAYSGLGQRDKAAALLARSQEIQRAAEQRHAAAAQRTITPPP